MLILVRGYKQSGKSQLINRMTAKPFNQEYEPTTITQTNQISWNSKNKQGEKIKITLLDVVSPNALITSTAQGNPNGIIVMYDPRDNNSLQYAIDVIEQTPKTIPIAVLSNFQDIIPTDMHPKLEYLSHRFFHVCSSMKTNLGLEEIAKWLEYPRANMRVTIYQQLINQSDRGISRLLELFTPGGPKPIIPQTFVGDDLLNEPDAAGFWSDEDETPQQTEKRHKKHHKKQQSQGNPAVLKKRRPAVEFSSSRTQQQATSYESFNNDDDDLMNGIVEAAQAAKAVVGKDEIDFDEIGNEIKPVTRQQIQPKKSMGRKHHRKGHPKQSIQPIQENLSLIHI